MRKFRKIVALLCALAVLASAFGCAKGGDNSSTQQQSSAAEQSKADQESSQEEKNVKEGNSWEWENGTPVTLSYFYDKLVPTANFDKYWGKDYVSQKIIEDTGINLEFQFPPDNSHSKLQVLIAGGNLPDMMMSDYRNAVVQNLGDQRTGRRVRSWFR